MQIKKEEEETGLYVLGEHSKLCENAVCRDVRIDLLSPSVTLVESPDLSIVSSSASLFLVFLRGVSPKQWKIQYEFLKVTFHYYNSILVA